jgi:hypothetical protein
VLKESYELKWSAHVFAPIEYKDKVAKKAAEYLKDNWKIELNEFSNIKAKTFDA